MILFLSKILGDGLLLLLTVVNFLSVFEHGAPLIHIPSSICGIVPFCIILKVLNSISFLIKRLLYTVSHLERIHNSDFATALHLYL